MMATLDVEHERVLDALDVALELTHDMQAAYIQADPSERRLLNQAFFERIEVVDEKVVGFRFADPFGLLLGQPEDHQDGDLFDRWSESWNLGQQECITARQSENGSAEAKPATPY